MQVFSFIGFLILCLYILYNFEFVYFTSIFIHISSVFLLYPTIYFIKFLYQIVEIRLGIYITKVIIQRFSFQLLIILSFAEACLTLLDLALNKKKIILSKRDQVFSKEKNNNNISLKKIFSHCNQYFEAKNQLICNKRLKAGARLLATAAIIQRVQLPGSDLAINYAMLT